MDFHEIELYAVGERGFWWLLLLLGVHILDSLLYSHATIHLRRLLILALLKPCQHVQSLILFLLLLLPHILQRDINFLKLHHFNIAIKTILHFNLLLVHIINYGVVLPGLEYVLPFSAAFECQQGYFTLHVIDWVLVDEIRSNRLQLDLREGFCCDWLNQDKVQKFGLFFKGGLCWVLWDSFWWFDLLGLVLGSVTGVTACSRGKLLARTYHFLWP